MTNLSKKGAQLITLAKSFLISALVKSSSQDAMPVKVKLNSVGNDELLSLLDRSKKQTQWIEQEIVARGLVLVKGFMSIPGGGFKPTEECDQALLSIAPGSFITGAILPSGAKVPDDQEYVVWEDKILPVSMLPTKATSGKGRKSRVSDDYGYGRSDFSQRPW